MQCSAWRGINPESRTTLQTWQYQYHWSAVILIVANAAKVDASGFMKWAFNETAHMSKLTQNYATSFKVDLHESSVLKSEMQAGGQQANSTFVREQALLPPTRSSAADKALYTEFIEKFGTHYVSSAVFGTSLETMVMSSMSVVSTQP